jgi:hypothetical protein
MSNESDVEILGLLTKENPDFVGKKDKVAV